MTDLVIHHLRVRIIRKGALLWGEDPRRLARRAIAALPELLARQLGELGLEDEAVEIQAPVQLSLRGPLASLQESLGGPEGAPELCKLVRRALEEALGPALAHAPGRGGRRGPLPSLDPGAAPLGELPRSHLRGELDAELAGSSLELLEACHRALPENPAPGEAAARPLSAEERQEAQRLIEAFAASLAPPLQLLLRGALASLLEALSGRAGTPEELLEACHRALLETPAPGGAAARALSAEDCQEAQRRIEAFAAGLAPPIQLLLRGALASLLEALSGRAGTPELRNLVRKALEEEPDPAPSRAPEEEVRQKPPPPRSPGAAPLGELLQIHLRGELDAALAGSPLELLEAYHRALLENPAPGGAATRPLSAEDRQEAQRFIESFAAGLAPAVNWKERLRQRLLAAVSLAASIGLPPFDANIRELLDGALPLSPELRQPRRHEASPLASGAGSLATGPAAPRHAGAQGARGAGETGGAAPGNTPHAPGEPPGAVSPLPARDAWAIPPLESLAPLPFPKPYGGRAPAPREGSATRSTSKSLGTAEERPLPILPLLVACVLLRAGIVSRVMRHLAGAGCAEELPLWIAALMFKLGPRPVRGWMYPPELWTSAALLSGSNLFSGEGLVLFADAASVRWPELPSALLPVLAPEDAPLVAVSAEDGVALMTSTPMAPVWVGPADAALLQQLATGRALSRHPELPPALLPEAEECPSELAEGLRETLAALEGHPACPLARLPHFDRHIGVVAGWALARIGATLWPEEVPPAVLVLERFASLEVYVKRDEEGLAVRVPLGKRRADLSRTGLLADASRVPWLFGGSIRFRGA